MAEALSGAELEALVARVFQPGPADRGLAILVDLPDAQVADTPGWAQRRAMAADWCALLAGRTGPGYAVRLVLYRNAHSNNGELPERAWIHGGGPLPAAAEALDPAASVPFPDIYAAHSMLIAPTHFSATAPLKIAARSHPFRAATMPGFGPEMIPALRLDYTEINRRVERLKTLLDHAEGAHLRFAHPGGTCELHLDLRGRTAHASGGLLPRNGVAGNLPSGEAYLVPYEGERPGDPSRSAGELPVQFGPEVVRYRIEGNRAVAVLSEGPESSREAALIRGEPAYANLAELGLGVLAAFGIKPIGSVLLDEKLGLHIAFGRSDHFGGTVGPAQFSSPDAVIHIDRVYVPEIMPAVRVRALDLLDAGGIAVPVLRDDAYVLDFGAP
ncbi:MAG: hypothetical protein HY823_11940 [Acidobacteria bacterium]|nr:hypothetical protein [Acidobacteriota bacterium]